MRLELFFKTTAELHSLIAVLRHGNIEAVGDLMVYNDRNSDLFQKTGIYLVIFYFFSWYVFLKKMPLPFTIFLR